EGWGDRGYAWISANMVAKELRYAYRVHVNGASPGPMPGPSPSPSSGGGKNGCPSGQDRDVVFGKCVTACTSGARPAGGLCPPPMFKPFPSAPAPQPGPKPGPAPAPQPASGGCASGQGKDVMTGKCRPLCPSGRPAIGGLCLPHIR
ncbi:MAG: hypothetical protein ACYTGQ_18570, partial [Planctomycetota bacterium]